MLAGCAEWKKDPSVSKRCYGEQRYIPGSLTLDRRLTICDRQQFPLINISWQRMADLGRKWRAGFSL